MALYDAQTRDLLMIADQKGERRSGTDWTVEDHYKQTYDQISGQDSSAHDSGAMMLPARLHSRGRYWQGEVHFSICREWKLPLVRVAFVERAKPVSLSVLRVAGTSGLNVVSPRPYFGGLSVS
jgi:hypothetical protein